MADQMSELDEVTLRVLAIADRTNVAEQRRRAIGAYAAHARTDPDIAKVVTLILAARRKRDDRSNVYRLRSVRDA